MIQLGTLSCLPSITAATTSVTVTNQTGQVSPSRETSCSRVFMAVTLVVVEPGAERPAAEWDREPGATPGG